MMISFILLSFMVGLMNSAFAESNSKEGENDIIADISQNKHIHVVLLGASIGNAWNISSLSERINSKDFVFEYIHGGGFDKSQKLEEILSRKENKPDALFLKECAAYFPCNSEHIKSLMRQWIEECHQSGVMPIPTTVVPVTRLHSLKKFLIDIVKGRNPLKYGNPFKNLRNASILEYNDWIRSYSKKRKLSVLDLEAAVRYNQGNRFLREDYARIDGLHINRKAYEALDQIVVPCLRDVFRKDKKEN